MRKISTLLVLLLCFVGVVKADNIVFNAQSETALPGTLANGQYTWTSPTITAPADFKTLRLTFGGNIGDGKDGKGYPHVAIAEFYLFDKDGNRVDLTTGNFSSNATETNEGKSGLHALCNGFDVKQGSEGDYDWYWHSYWSAGANGLHYLEINVAEVTADLSTFTFKYVTRQANGTPTELLVTTGSSTENVASQAQSSQLLFANYDLANQPFRLKNSNITDADLYMTIETPKSNNQNDGGVKILEKSVQNANSQAFKFEETDNGFYIESESGYYLNTLDNWGFNAVESASDNSKFEIIYVGEGEFKIKGTKGYVGPNNSYKTDHPYEMFSNHTSDKFYLDWTLEPYVVEYEVVYNYKLNGEVIKTETHVVSNTEDYPDLKTAFGMTTSDMKPEGKVNANGTFNFNYTSTVPFTWETNADAISNWYTIKMHSNNKKYIKYIANGNYLSWADTQFDLGKRDVYAWAFVGNPFDGFKLVNKALGAGKALKSTNGGNPSMQNVADATVFVYAQSDVTGAGYFCLQYPGGNYLNAQNGKVAHWGDNDAGSTMEVAVVPEYTLENYVADLTTLKGQAQSFVNNHKDNADAPGFYSKASLDAIQKQVDAEVNTTDEASVDAVFVALKQAYENPVIALPVAGKFYRIMNNAKGEGKKVGYLESKAGTGKTVFTEGIGEKANSVFYFTGEKLVAYTTGLYLTMANSNMLSYTDKVGESQGTIISFSASPELGKLLIAFDNGNRSFYSDNVGESNAASKGQTGDSYRFTVSEVTWLPIPVNEEAGYTTLYSPVELALSDNRFKAYTVSETSETSATLTEQTVVPAGVGVVLELQDGAEVKDGCVFLQVKATETTGVTSALLGTYADEFITTDAYVLGYINVAEEGQPEDKQVGFYTATKNQQEGASWLNNGFKAYLPKTVPANALRFNFGGNTTAIESVLNGVDANAPIYDLSGRRVMNAVKGGIYIQNGKKFIVK